MLIGKITQKGKKKKERNQQKIGKHKKWMGARVIGYGQGKNPAGKNDLAL